MGEIRFNYEGNRFVVVGASSGIGKQIALELAQAGATVLCLARRTELIERIDVKNRRGKIVSAFADVTKISSGEWDKVLKKFVDEYGKINGAVYTAGVAGLTSIRGLNEKLAQRIMDTSYWGMLRFIQSANKKRFSEDGSSFVVFSSVTAYTAYLGLLVYSSAKSAVQTAVKSIAKEISIRRNRINSISPGWLSDTGMTNGKADTFSNREILASKILLGEGTADKISGMTLFLLSNRADWITGTDLVVDGGMLLSVGGYLNELQTFYFPIYQRYFGYLAQGTSQLA